MNENITNNTAATSTITAIFESNDGSFCSTYIHDQFPSVEAAFAASEYHIEDDRCPHGRQEICRFCVPNKVAEMAQEWIESISSHLEGMGLRVTKREFVPARDPNQEHLLTGLCPGMEVTLKIGHWNGLDDRGPFDKAVIRTAFIQKTSFGAVGVEKTDFYSTEPSWNWRSIAAPGRTFAEALAVLLATETKFFVRTDSDGRTYIQFDTIGDFTPLDEVLNVLNIEKLNNGQLVFEQGPGGPASMGNRLFHGESAAGAEVVAPKIYFE